MSAYERSHPELNNIMSDFTNGHGFDKVIITASTDSSDPLDLATDSVIDRGRITVVGDIPLNVSRGKFYDKELTLNLSRSYGAGRYSKNYEEYGLDYPIEYVRWTENRNMEAIVNLISEGSLSFNDFNVKIFDFNDSPSAYDFLNENTKYLTGLFSYSDFNKEKINRTTVFSKSLNKNDKINIGFIGLGNYSQSILMPIIRKNKNLYLRGLYSREGRKGTHLAKKYNFDYLTTDSKRILTDKEIDLIFVATRHNQHAKYIIASFINNKNVFVEKPLAINQSELGNIKKAYEASTSHFMIGFNRRFSSLTKYVKEELSNIRPSTIYIDYTINSDLLSSSHWLNDIKQGGGRLVGEGCHFLDFCSYLIEKDVASHSIDFLGVDNSKPKDDSFVLKTKYLDNSVSNIAYISSTQSLPKEVINVTYNGGKIVITDFKLLEHYNNSKILKRIKINQDKGQSKMIEEWVSSLQNNSPLINFEKVLNISKDLIELRDNN